MVFVLPFDFRRRGAKVWPAVEVGRFDRFRHFLLFRFFSSDGLGFVYLSEHSLWHDLVWKWWGVREFRRWGWREHTVGNKCLQLVGRFWRRFSRWKLPEGWSVVWVRSRGGSILWDNDFPGVPGWCSGTECSTVSRAGTRARFMSVFSFREM